MEADDMSMCGGTYVNDSPVAILNNYKLSVCNPLNKYVHMCTTSCSYISIMKLSVVKGEALSV